MTIEELLAGQILLIDKPYGWTSFQSVNKVKAAIRRATGLKKFKIGHAGTLDPLATGLLLVCVGRATKEIPYLQDGEKVYTGTMVLGATTPCYDMEQGVDKTYPTQHITPQLVEKVRNLFLGPQQQVPPMFSAVKINGQRAYQYARTDGQPMEIEPKSITIHEFQTHNLRPAEATAIPQPAPQDETHLKKSAPHLYDNPQGFIPEGTMMLDFKVKCSKGTYIRSLARDFGAELQSGAFLSSLRREQIGDRNVDQALSLDTIDEHISGLFT